MDKDYLILKRASASRPSGEWDDDDYGVLADGVVVGRIMKAAAVPAKRSYPDERCQRGSRTLGQISTLCGNEGVDRGRAERELSKLAEASALDGY
jgi:hypothetical protein